MITRDNFSSIITDNTIVVNYNGETHMLSRTEAAAPKVIQAIKDGRLNDIPNLISVSKQLESASGGRFTVKNGQVYVDGVVAPTVLGRKIEAFANEGLPYAPLVNFAKKLQANPSFRAVNELYQFLEKNNHPVTEDGCFIAYKKVSPNFMDLYTGTIDNSPGETPSVPRNQVDEDPTRTCSNGLHVANWHYAANCYGSSTDTMLEVKVDPADVVAVPVDYNQAKMRVCKYFVIGVVKEEVSTTSLRVVDPNYNECTDDCADSCEPEAKECTDHDCCNNTDVDEEEEKPLCGLCYEYHYDDEDCVEDDEEEEYCEDCGEYYDACDDHVCEEDEEYCSQCDEYYPAEEFVSHECDEEEEEEDEDDADDYPWDDEINE